MPRQVFRISDGSSQRGASSSGSSSSGTFDSGTVMLFRQSSAPTGWTKDTTNNDNSALRVVTGNVSTGGTDDFSTTFGTSKTTASHTLTTSQIPAHTHGYALRVPVTGRTPGSWNVTLSASGLSISGGGSAANTGGVTSTSTGSVGSSGAHSHNLSNFNIKFTDVIQASKD